QRKSCRRPLRRCTATRVSIRSLNRTGATSMRSGSAAATTRSPLWRVKAMPPDVHVDRAGRLATVRVPGAAIQDLEHRDEIHPAGIVVIDVADHGVADLVHEHCLLHATPRPKARVATGDMDGAGFETTQGG